MPTAITELPAIAGGQPAKSTPFSRGKRYGDDELQELREALDQGTLFYAHGTKVKQMETEFAAVVGRKFGIATSSGTASIHTALMAAGISPGDEVVIPPITDMGTVFPVLWQGAIPVFADVDPRSYVMTPKSVEAVLTPKTKAVVAVHLWGNACDLAGLAELCHARGVMLIEDCAQAHGTTYRGKYIGTYGEIGCFSLNEFKHIACGDGGIVLADDEKLAERLRLSTDKCYKRVPGAALRDAWFLANNYRMTELQGAVARAQLRKLDAIIAARRSWCSRLQEALAKLPGLLVPQPTEGCDPSWWFYMLRVDEAVTKADAVKVAEALQAEGLPCSPNYIRNPVYDCDVFRNHHPFDRGTHPFAARDYNASLCPVAEEVLRTAVVLAINEGYSEPDLQETISGFSKVFNWFARNGK